MVHSTTSNAPYIHPSPDSIIKLWRTFPNMTHPVLGLLLLPTGSPSTTAVVCDVTGVVSTELVERLGVVAEVVTRL